MRGNLSRRGHQPGAPGAARHKPDIAIPCINGGFNNLSRFEAATAMGQVRPKVAIPCHYDMFPDNSLDPAQSRASLKIRAPEVRCRRLDYGEPFVFEKEG